MLNLSFAGTLGADPETRSAGSSEVTEFRVAVNGYDRKAKAKTTTWLKVTIWGQRGPQIANLVGKGSRVAGSGAFEVQTYTDRDGQGKTRYVVNVQDLTVLTFREAGEEPAPEAKSKGRAAPVDGVGDDDFPL